MLNFIMSQMGQCGRCTTCSDEDRQKANDELLFDERTTDGAIPDRPLLLGFQHLSVVSNALGPGVHDFDGEYDEECEGAAELPISARGVASETRAEMTRRLRTEAEERDRALRELRPKVRVNQSVPPLALPTSDDEQVAAEHYCASPPSTSEDSFSHQRSLCADIVECAPDLEEEALPAHETEKPMVFADKVSLSDRSTVDNGSEKPTFRSISDKMGSFSTGMPSGSEYGSEKPSNRSGPCQQKPTLLGSKQHADDAFAKELHEKRQAQAQERASQTRRHHKLRSFLASGGFREGVNSRKPIRSGVLSWGFSYPLHAAVKANDADAIEVLLWAGADRSLADSEGLTPLALAQRLDKGHSHRKVAICLSS